jgi:hypothetical protein
MSVDRDKSYVRLGKRLHRLIGEKRSLEEKRSNIDPSELSSYCDHQVHQDYNRICLEVEGLRQVVSLMIIIRDYDISWDGRLLDDPELPVQPYRRPE